MKALAKHKTFFSPFAKVEEDADGNIKVYGIASTEAEDSDGETVKSSAVEAAIPDYMKFGAVREMHQPKAAGTAIDISVDSSGITNFAALIVDPDAIKKVKNGVYKGFSIGGNVTARDSVDKTVITGIDLIEVSLVDRPANPDAVINLWKAKTMKTPQQTPIAKAVALTPESAVEQLADMLTKGHVDAVQLLSLAKKAKEADAGQTTDQSQVNTGTTDGNNTIADDGSAQGAGKAGNGENDAEGEGATTGETVDEGDDYEAMMKDDKDADADAKKPYGEVEYADKGLLDDGKHRYPVDTAAHIRAAWSYINMPKNSGQYSASDLKTVKSNIVQAWKDKINADGPPEADTKKSAKAHLQKSEEMNPDYPPVGAVVHLTAAQVGGQADVQGKITNLDGNIAGVELPNGEIKVDISGFAPKDDGEGGAPAWASAANGLLTVKTGKPSTLLKAMGVSDLHKGMYSVSDFAYLLQSILYLQESIEWEAQMEQDGSDMPDAIKSWMADGAKLLVAYVTEEASELAGLDMSDPDNAPATEVLIELASKSTSLFKSSMTMLQKAGARHSKADMEKIQKAHDSLADLGAVCKSAEVEPTPTANIDTIQAGAGAGDLKKAMTEAQNNLLSKVEKGIIQSVDGKLLKMQVKLNKAHGVIEDFAKRLAVVEKAAVPPKAATMSVTKNADVHASGNDSGDAPTPVKTSTGEIDPAASAIKAAQAKPLQR